MSDSKKVSVCLPIFDGGKFLSAAIESVLNQSYSNLELLIADDYADDNSVQIVQQFVQSDKRVSYWRNPCRLGIFASYNACISRAAGEYIKPFYQNDVLAVDGIEKLVQALSSQPTAALATGSRQIIAGDGDKIKIEQAFETSGVIAGEEIISHYLNTFYNRVGVCSQILFRKKHVGDGFDPTYVSLGDIDFELNVLQHGDLAHIIDIVCTLRKQPDCLTELHLSQMSFMADTFRLVDKHITALKKVQNSANTIYYCALESMVGKIDQTIQAGELDFLKAADSKSHSPFSLSSFSREANYDFQKMARHTLLYATAVKRS